MIISLGHKYIFVHALKTAGTSMALTLEARVMKDDIILGDTPKEVKRRKRLRDVKTAGRLWKHSILADVAARFMAKCTCWACRGNDRVRGSKPQTLEPPDNLRGCRDIERGAAKTGHWALLNSGCDQCRSCKKPRVGSNKLGGNSGAVRIVVYHPAHTRCAGQSCFRGVLCTNARRGIGDHGRSHNDRQNPNLSTLPRGDGNLLSRAGRITEAKVSFKSAIELSENAQEIAFLRNAAQRLRH